MNFCRQFEEISARMSKLFPAKDTLWETTEAFAALASQCDEHKEPEVGLIALAKSGEM
jgi:hypothetical protein